MRALTASAGGMLALLLVPLSLSASTAWLLLPAHGALTLLALLGSVLEGLAGWPRRARLWGAAYLVATAAMVGALSLGAEVRSSGLSYWGAPWIAAVVWGWPVPLVSGFSGWLGERRLRRRVALTVAQRRGPRARPSSPSA